MKTSFQIDHVDPLGQGVSKISDKITFIKKTLPGETGIAEVISQKKGIQFAQLLSLEQVSQKRISPECPHFELCNGCDYLHTHYSEECELKKKNIARSLTFLKLDQFQFHPSDTRFDYRNRVQLHYDLLKNQLGYMNNDRSITSIQNCRVAHPQIQAKINELLHDETWKKLVHPRYKTGHLELYLKHGRVQVALNKPYADGGFSQVHEKMNLKMKSEIDRILNKIIQPNDIVFDLFGGDGNLTQSLTQKTFVIDFYNGKVPSAQNQKEFLDIDLYQADAIKKLKYKTKINPQVMIIDPPRSGLKNIIEFYQQFRPNYILLVACDFANFQRELKSLLSNYKAEQPAEQLIHELHFFDLFPGTRHFESMALFTTMPKSK